MGEEREIEWWHSGKVPRTSKGKLAKTELFSLFWQLSNVGFNSVKVSVLSIKGNDTGKIY